jgi:four helix bundle protein
MSSSQHISEQIEDRMLNFSVNSTAISKSLPITIENEILKKQLVRSSASIGANYIEANNASSKLDFRNKIFIAKKEAAETRYWLKILSATNPDVKIEGLLNECSQFLFILQKIVSSLKNSKLKA